MTMVDALRAELQSFWNMALLAADPAAALASHWTQPGKGRLIVYGAGKAAAPMAVAAARLSGGRAQGLCVTRYDHGLRAGEDSGAIQVIEAAHPVSNAASLMAGNAVLRLTDGLQAEDSVVCVLSGGASALMEVPLPGITLEDIQQLQRALLASGAPIHELNCVRKHLSAIKGGRLAAAAHPAQFTTYAMSDVPGDDLSTIGSGPGVADPTTQAEAKAILDRHRIALPASVAAVLCDPSHETLKPGDPKLARAQTVLIATPAQMLARVSAHARALGYRTLERGDATEGDAADVAREEAALAHAAAARGERLALIAGGELTVRVSGTGSGGPMQHYALSLAAALGDHPAIAALAADTDGIDGKGDAAGAFVLPGALARARAQSLDPRAFLTACDSGGWFARIGDALTTGPTRTNLSHVRILLVNPL